MQALTVAEHDLAGAGEAENALGMKLGDLLMPLRVAVTGSKVSPPLVESIRVMGVAEARRRAARAIAILKESIPGSK